MLARELLSKPDGFIFAINEKGEEYVVNNFKRIVTQANIDDSVLHWRLSLKKVEGNIKR